MSANFSKFSVSVLLAVCLLGGEGRADSTFSLSGQKSGFLDDRVSAGNEMIFGIGSDMEGLSERSLTGQPVSLDFLVLPLNIDAISFKALAPETEGFSPSQKDSLGLLDVKKVLPSRPASKNPETATSSGGKKYVPIPEPGSWALITLTLMALIFFRKRVAAKY